MLELAAALQQNVEITLFNTSPNQINLNKNHKSKNNFFTVFYYKDLVNRKNLNLKCNIACNYFYLNE